MIIYVWAVDAWVTYRFISHHIRRKKSFQKRIDIQFLQRQIIYIINIRVMNEDHVDKLR